MLAHRSGMIGFPLRLLARENYDRAVTLKGADKVALITGEEKIIPAGAKYFLCTVESMPVDRPVEFLGIDEIQVCADPERGHIFTDRLLNARGISETMFMGADTIRPLITKLVRGVEFVSRPRFSTLTYSGERKITRLPPQSVVVAFSASDVYAIAERIRRHRGGAAVVMGALSPRTRNAQVAMYQAGEVDHLVATDAIGMGLNMDVNHVAFAATSKFDGHRQRPLFASELAQIAGRAGRHMNDGTFGVTQNVAPISEDYVDRIENHNFRSIKLISWRNPEPDLSTLDTLQRSLVLPPDQEGLVRAVGAADEQALSLLALDPDIARLATRPEAVSLLWEVCQIPDFRNVLSEGHAELLGRIYSLLMTSPAMPRLPTDWVAGQVKRVDRIDGDIETLTGRLANIRTWTYIAHRGTHPGNSWLEDPMAWQEKTQVIEDRLSDALHESLTQRFVDRRTSLLVKRLKTPDEDIVATVDQNNAVSVEGHVIGHLSGFRFIADKSDAGDQSIAAKKSVAAAAKRVLGAEILRRIDWLEATADSTITVGDDMNLIWREAPIGAFVRGSDILSPHINLIHDGHLPEAGQQRLTHRLEKWRANQLDGIMAPLIKAQKADLSGASRGLVFQIREELGTLRRTDVKQQVDALDRDDRQALRKQGIVIGRESIFLPALLKPAALRARALLWSLWNEGKESHEAPPPGRVSVPVNNFPAAFLTAVGYRKMGQLAIRVDMLERMAAHAWSLARKGPFAIDPDILSLAGCGIEDMKAILKDLGFAPAPAKKIAVTDEPAEQDKTEPALYVPAWKVRKRQVRPKKKKAAPVADTRKTKSGKPARPAKPVYDPDSPFAKLKELSLTK